MSRVILPSQVAASIPSLAQSALVKVLGGDKIFAICSDFTRLRDIIISPSSSRSLVGDIVVFTATWSWSIVGRNVARGLHSQRLTAPFFTNVDQHCHVKPQCLSMPLIEKSQRTIHTRSTRSQDLYTFPICWHFSYSSRSEFLVQECRLVGYCWRYRWLNKCGCHKCWSWSGR